METEKNKENFSLSSDFNTESYLGSDRVIDSDLQRYSSNIEELNSNNDASTSRGSINLREKQEICVNYSFGEFTLEASQISIRHVYVNCLLATLSVVWKDIQI